MIENNWTHLSATAKRHLRAICGNAVTRSNVIGLRKAFNHCARLDQGLSGNRSAVTQEEAKRLDSALAEKQPRVVGELHDSGLKLLRDPRYKKLWTPEQAAAIERLAFFRLLPFTYLDALHCVPTYRAFTDSGPAFAFYHVPWQAALYGDFDAGPHIVPYSYGAGFNA